MYEEPQSRRTAMNAMTNIAGLVCLTGFLLDVIAILLRPDFSAVEWRMGVIQQLGDRCLLLVFGAALLCYGLQRPLTRRKAIATSCMVLGSCLALCSMFYLWDSFHFQSAAIQNLTSQQQKLEQKIQDFAAPSLELKEPVDTAAQKNKAISLLQERTVDLESRARQRLRKTVVRTLKNLLLSAIGLLFLGKMSLNLNWNRGASIQPSSP